MYLHQNDTFAYVNVNGAGLGAGVYPCGTLAAMFPATFPLFWTSVFGSAISNAAGSITVLTGVPVMPAAVNIAPSGTNLSLAWSQGIPWSKGILMQATNVAGPWIMNTAAVSPYTITPLPGIPQMYYRISFIGTPASGMELNCQAPVVAVVNGTPAASNSVSADVQWTGAAINNQSRTFPLLSNISIVITATSTGNDNVVYEIEDYAGALVAGGTQPIKAGTSTVTLACTANLPGYFALQASLQTSGAILTCIGTRPQGMATFGIKPDLSSVLPAVTFTNLDDHRFGWENHFYVSQNLVGPYWSFDMDKTDVTDFSPSDIPPTTNTETQLGLIPYYTVDNYGANSGLSLPTNISAYSNGMKTVGQLAEARREAVFPTMLHNYYQPTWEPFNWSGGVAGMQELYQAAYTGLHAGDPNAVVLGDTEYTVQNTVSDLTTYNLWAYLDGISFHGYGAGDAELGDGPDAVPSYLAGLRSLRSLMVAHLPAHAKEYCSEVGYGYPSIATATYPNNQTLAMHAVYNMRSDVMILGEGANVTVFYWDIDYDGTGFGFYFGISQPFIAYGEFNPCSPKPTAMAAATLVRLLDHTKTLGAITNLPSNVTGYLFRDASDKVIAALWAHNLTFTGSATINLPVDAAGQGGAVNLVDMMGNITTSSYTNGQLTLTLGENLVYVIANGTAANYIPVLTPAGY
jgi:hypothetical protein